MVDTFHDPQPSGTGRFSLRLALPADRIDVWPFRTDKPGFSLSRLERVLSEDELARANRFRIEHLRSGYLISRGVLRMLCARYLNMAPEALRFQYGKNGKPSLAPDSPLGFNVSHSGGLILFAFAWNLELGVDVEQIRRISEMEAVSNRFFCAEEAGEVLSHRAEEREPAFYTCWTRKEAFIKATGDGLSMPLDSFRVSLGHPAHFRHINFDENEAKRWTLHGLELPTPYTGALCYKGEPRTVHMTAV